MTAFAGNSLLCRLALKETAIDAATFTLVRIASGTIVLWIIFCVRGGRSRSGGNLVSGVALFVYAGAFSFAYLSLSAGTGALLLFGAVQITMILCGLCQGEQLRGNQWLGFAIALAGFVTLVSPGLSAPPFVGTILMLAAGISWGVYSLRGRGRADPLGATAGNFLLSLPFAVTLSLILLPWLKFDRAGVEYAVLSGAIASGVGYAIWYAVLPALKAMSAAAVQLSVPVLAAVGGIVFLAEPITVRLLIASIAILGGIALVVRGKRLPLPSKHRVTASS